MRYRLQSCTEHAGRRMPEICQAQSSWGLHSQLSVNTTPYIDSTDRTGQDGNRSTEMQLLFEVIRGR